MKFVISGLQPDFVSIYDVIKVQQVSGYPNYDDAMTEGVSSPRRAKSEGCHIRSDSSFHHLETNWWLNTLRKSGWHFFSLEPLRVVPCMSTSMNPSMSPSMTPPCHPV